MIVLSRWQALPFLIAQSEGVSELETTLDLNLTRTRVALTDEGVVLTDGVLLPWAAVAEIADHDTGCFVVEETGELERLYVFSETTKRAVSLSGHPTGAPTMFVAGFPMHRTKAVDPWQDTEHKIAAVTPISGRVLDICMGLGYTAILASKSASSVTTIELDPAVEAVAQRNPWSQPLFAGGKITRRLGDAFEVLKTLPSGAFDVVLHDPPTMQLAGELYSGAFYREILRVLSRRGKLFHYIGSPESRHGATVTKGVVRRLHEAGFAAVAAAPDAYGVVAYREKPRR